jgi:thiamine-phosphate pyrophosphorylase
MGFRFPSPLYAIVDPCGRPDADLARLAGAFLDGGVRLLQLRWKGAPAGRLHDAAGAIQGLCAAHGAIFVVNDRVDVALAVGADGVHLGQDDLPLAAARRLVGTGRVIGISTHDRAQAEAAAAGGADYVGFGPLFGTKTKDTGHAARGLAALAEVRRTVAVPIVAIGGLTAENARSALGAGADAVAMISELALAADPAAKTRSVLAALGGLRR